jgi:putative redox protein
MERSPEQKQPAAAEAGAEGSMTVTWLQGSQLAVDAGRHRLLVDQPEEEGGEDQGMTPVELLLASLGSCIGYFAARFCQRHHMPPDGLRVTMAWEYEEKPHRVGSMTAHVHLPQSVAAALEPEMRARMQKVLEGCTVHNSIAITPRIGVTITTEPPRAPLDVRGERRVEGREAGGGTDKRQSGLGKRAG